MINKYNPRSFSKGENNGQLYINYGEDDKEILLMGKEEFKYDGNHVNLIQLVSSNESRTLSILEVNWSLNLF